MVTIEELCFSYGSREVLRRVGFTVQPGAKVGLLGPNGAGKSSLLLHLNGILQGRGNIVIDGLVLNAANLGRIRQKVGLVFQDPDDQLFCPTVFEDVAYGPLYAGLPAVEVEQRVERALAAVGMQQARERSPHQLSGGEKRRVALATVLSMQPSLLALDEPTNGLDPRARRSLIELLRLLPNTMLVATHDLAMLEELLPEAIVMNEGRIVYQGTTAALLADKELLERHGLTA
ncbi:MAG: ABC transporter ATP-binding protein [Candidatus Eremiobacteraeota bacterium]|nr:ABC transporter ATP-binding protein [Candidatus Eremiobacteraeota bacterium]MCW5867034.1 ABC transporter ATP-binding protein [Candidatus Eremiobacteraeota bacterium]